MGKPAAWRGRKSLGASWLGGIVGLSNSSSGGATKLRPQREGAEAISHQTQLYESSASPMVLLTSELVLLLADRPKLEGMIYLKETERCRDDDKDGLF